MGLTMSERRSLTEEVVRRYPLPAPRRLQDETLAAIRARGGGLRTADNLKRDALHQRDALP